MALSDDMLLMAKQFKQIAETFCPQPPVRVAKGVLITTIRLENTHYLGMGACNCYVGNEKCFYMPYTNEPWLSAKAYPTSRYKTILGVRAKDMTAYQNGDESKLRKIRVDTGAVGVRKNPNEHWWDKAVAQVVALDLDQEKGVMIVG